MESLITSLRITLANSFEMYFKAHGHHWNIEGMEFSQLHEFFGSIYEEIHGAIDPIAEEIRKLDATVPYGLASMSTFTTVEPSSIYGANPRTMMQDLEKANDQVIESLNTSLKLAEQENLQGLMNFLAERLEAHTKHGWMLRASLK